MHVLRRLTARLGRSLTLGFCSLVLAQTATVAATPGSGAKPGSLLAQVKPDADPLVPLQGAAPTFSAAESGGGQISLSGLSHLDYKEFVDPENKIGGRYPAQWVLTGGKRWGERNTTLFFVAPGHPEANPSIYHRPFADVQKLDGPQIVEWLRDAANAKVRQRLDEGYKNYTNREATLRRVRDRPALTWVADYSHNGERWVEYLTRIYSPAGTTLLFMQAPAREMPALIPQFETVIQSMGVP